MNRLNTTLHRVLPLLALLFVSTTAHSEGIVPDVEERSVAELQQQMQSGQLTSHALVQAYLARIDALDRKGPKLNAVIELNPDALTIADAMDAERKQGKLRGALHGIPVLIKDNIDTADGMLTTAGSLALIGSRPSADAWIVQRLRNAGAIILGKTNLSEWANLRSTHASSGWSGRGGQTHNPYVLDRNPCGSSSGSGVAVSANLATIAVGTETDGSIVCPSSINGIVGLKPTVGLVSRSGIIPISASQDTAGPMARSVADVAALLNVLAARDPQDSATQVVQTKKIPDYTAALRADALRGARIGVARKMAGISDNADALFAQSITAMKTAGAVIVDPADIVLPKGTEEAELDVLLDEFKDGINRYLAARPSGPHDLAALIRFNDEHRTEEMPYFGQELFTQAQQRKPLSDAVYRKTAARIKAAARKSIDAVLNKNHLDAIVAPTVGPAWTTDWINGDHVSGGSSSTAAAIAGYPHITVPAGAVNGLPMGLSFIGTAWSESKLIGLAYAFEQKTNARKASLFLPTLP